MAAHSLFPAFVRIAYHSAYGAHLMTIPTRPWAAVTVAGLHGAFYPWNAEDFTRDADDMIKDLVTLLAEFMPSSAGFDSYTIYTMTDQDAPAVPQSANALAIPGVVTASGWSKAVQYTWTFRCSNFALFKLVLLDAHTANNFDKILPSDATSAMTDVINEVETDENGWSARDAARPTTFLQLAYTLNDKLRRSYGMN